MYKTKLFVALTAVIGFSLAVWILTYLNIDLSDLDIEED